MRKCPRQTFIPETLVKTIAQKEKKKKERSNRRGYKRALCSVLIRQCLSVKKNNTKVRHLRGEGGTKNKERGRGRRRQDARIRFRVLSEQGRVETTARRMSRRDELRTARFATALVSQDDLSTRDVLCLTQSGAVYCCCRKPPRPIALPLFEHSTCVRQDRGKSSVARTAGPSLTDVL